MIIDKKGMIFGKLNVIDLTVILVILIIAAGALWYFGRSSEDQTPTSVNFTVEFRRKDETFGQNIPIGGTVNDSVRGNYLGLVQNVEVIEEFEVIYDQNENRFVESPIPGLYRVMLTVSANGSENERDICAEGQPIKVGQQMFIKGKGFASIGYVTKLSSALAN